MRVVAVFFAGKNRNRLLNVTKALSRGLESQGHQVDIIDGDRDINAKLTIYGYIAVGTTAVNTWGGKIPEKVSAYLANAGIVAGKRCFAYTINSSMRTGKTLSRLTRAAAWRIKISEIIEFSTCCLLSEEMGSPFCFRIVSI